MLQLPGGVWRVELHQVPHSDGSLRGVPQVPQLPHGVQVLPQRPEPHQHAAPDANGRTGQVRLLPIRFCASHTRRHGGFRSPSLLSCRMIYKCVMCDTVFTQKPLLYTHFDTHLAKQKVHVFKCPDCTKLYAQKGSMMEHIKVHFFTHKRSFIVNVVHFCLFCVARLLSPTVNVVSIKANSNVLDRPKQGFTPVALS